MNANKSYDYNDSANSELYFLQGNKLSVGFDGNQQVINVERNFHGQCFCPEEIKDIVEGTPYQTNFDWLHFLAYAPWDQIVDDPLDLERESIGFFDGGQMLLKVQSGCPSEWIGKGGWKIKFLIKKFNFFNKELVVDFE